MWKLQLIERIPEYIKNNIKVLVIHVNCMKKHDGSFETR